MESSDAVNRNIEVIVNRIVHKIFVDHSDLFVEEISKRVEKRLELTGLKPSIEFQQRKIFDSMAGP